MKTFAQKLFPLVAAVAGAAAAQQADVSDINEVYRAANLDVDVWVERFENEGREALPAASVDVVFICDAYHHFEDYAAMLESIHTALRPGGKLVVVEYDRVEGESPEFVLEHIRASKEQFTAEIEAHGFRFTKDATVDGMQETFVRHFERR
jgi:predicted methyltransferase